MDKIAKEEMDNTIRQEAITIIRKRGTGAYISKIYQTMDEREYISKRLTNANNTSNDIYFSRLNESEY